jgi:hypothetical protein
VIRRLLRHDAALRPLLWAIPTAAGWGLGLAAVTTLLSRSGGEALAEGTASTLLLPAMISWLAGALAVRPTLRATEFQLSLPIPAASLMEARVLALAAYALLPPAAFVAGTVALGAPPEVTGTVAAFAASAASALLLAFMLVQCGAPARASVPDGAARRAGLVLGALALALAVSHPDPLLATALLAAALVVAGWVLRMVPPALTLAVGARDGSAGAAIAARPAGRYTLARLLAEGGLGPQLVLVPLLGAWFAISQTPSLWSFALAVPFFLWQSIALSVAALAWLDPLPIPRRVLLAVATLPALAGLMLGLFGGEAVNGQPRERPLDFTLQCERGSSARECFPQVTVPRGYWRLTATGVAPGMVTPWGEEARPVVHAILRGLPPAIYNPYAVEEHSGLELVALQLSRAARDVYGVEVAPDEIARRYLRHGRLGEVRLVGDGFTLAEDQALAARSPIGALALLAVLTWFAASWLALRGLPIARPTPRRAVFALALLVLAGLVFLGMDVDLIYWSSEFLPQAVAARLPANAAAIGAVLATLALLFFLVLDRRFTRLELKSQARPVKKGWAWFAVVPVLIFPVVFLSPELGHRGAALHQQASTGGERWVALLLWLRTPPDALDPAGETPLLRAAYSGHAGIVRRLLEHGAAPEARDGSGNAALNLVSWSDDAADRLGCAAALLDHGADVNVRGMHGATPLIDAAMRDRARMIALLAARGADLEARDALGYTALQRATQNRYEDSVRALLAAGARPQ